MTNIIDSVDLGDIQRAADAGGAGLSARDLALGLASGQYALSWDTLIALAKSCAAPAIRGFARTLALFSAPPLVSAICARVAGRHAKIAGLVCACACASAFMGEITILITRARDMLDWIAAAVSAILPAMASLGALAGATGSTAMLTPMAGVAGKLIVDTLGGAGAGLTAICAAIASATAFAPALRLDGLFSLFKGVAMWGAGVLFAVFVGILTVQGMLGASFDSAAVRTARFAVDNLIPVVGGDIADSLDAALSSVLLVKSAVGVTGVIIIARGCITALAGLLSSLVGARAAHALTLCVAEPSVSGAVERFADVIRALITICLVALLVALVLTGAAICAGRAVLR